MDDENRRKFRERLRKLELRSEEEDDDLSLGVASRRRRRSGNARAGFGLRLVGALLSLTFAFLFVKAIVIAHEGTDRYAERIREASDDSSSARIISLLMKPDPLSVAMARLWQKVSG